MQDSDHGSLDNTENQMHDQMRQPLDWKKIRSRDFDFHIKIPEFIGTLQVEEFIDWIVKVEQIK